MLFPSRTSNPSPRYMDVSWQTLPRMVPVDLRPLHQPPSTLHITFAIATGVSTISTMAKSKYLRRPCRHRYWALEWPLQAHGELQKGEQLRLQTEKLVRRSDLQDTGLRTALILLENIYKIVGFIEIQNGNMGSSFRALFAPV